MTTPEHKVAMHRLATTRRQEGKPAWDYTVNLGDIWNRATFDGTPEEHRKAIAERIRASRWVRQMDKDVQEEVEDILDRMAEAEDDEEFDWALGDLYDQADWDRCWFDRWSK